MSMNRRQFLQSLAAAVAVSLVPKVLVPDSVGVQATYRVAEATLRPTYLAWLNEAKYHRLVFLALRRHQDGSPHLGSWPGDSVPSVDLCLQKLDLPSSRPERLAVLLALQEQHPWPDADWRAETTAAGSRRDEAKLVEMLGVYREEHGYLPRVYSPADLHQMGVEA